jgi:hypothetical protein
MWHQLTSHHPILAASVLAAWCALSNPAKAQQAQGAPHLDVIYVPTPHNVVDRMLKMAQVRRDDYVIDLGSGDGRIPITAAKTYGTRGFGVDIDPNRVREARQSAANAGVADRVEFRMQNLFDTRISDASILTMYLMPDINLKLRPRILGELRPGTRVVSHDFDMEDWRPDQRAVVGRSKIYLWIVPARVEGRRTVRTGDGQTFTVDLQQRYQEVQGTATVNGRVVPLLRGRLHGDEISFGLDMGKGRIGTFRGRVHGDTIQVAAPRPANPRKARQ